MKSLILLAVSFFTFHTFAGEPTVITTNKVMAYNDSFEFQIDSKLATQDGLVQFMEATSEDVFAEFEGGACHSSTHLMNVIKKDNGFIEGSIVMEINGGCILPGQIESEVIKKAQRAIQQDLKLIPGLLVHW